MEWITAEEGEEERTDGDTLRIVVRLHMVDVDTDKLKVDFVLDVRHENEGCHHTLALGSGHLGAHLAVPCVVVGRQQGTRGALGECQEQRLVLVDDRLALGLPVDLGGVAEVGIDGLDIVEVLEGVGGGFAEGVGHARVDVVRVDDVAAAQTEGSHATLAVLCARLAMMTMGDKGAALGRGLLTAAARRVFGTEGAATALCAFVVSDDGVDQGRRRNGSREGASEHGERRIGRGGCCVDAV
jgi:hypothetical protein